MFPELLVLGADAASVLVNGLLFDCVKSGADDIKLPCSPTCGPGPNWDPACGPNWDPTGQPLALLNRLFKVSFAF